MLHAILRVCFATVESARIKSLRDASAKMSKSDADESACVLLCDSADTIVHKIRRSDQTSHCLPTVGRPCSLLPTRGCMRWDCWCTLEYMPWHRTAGCSTFRMYSRLCG